MAVCALTGWQHFSVRNDVMAAILKVWRQVENPTLSIDANLLEEYSCQISHRFDLKRRSRRRRRSPQQEQQQQQQQQQQDEQRYGISSWSKNVKLKPESKYGDKVCVNFEAGHLLCVICHCSSRPFMQWDNETDWTSDWGSPGNDRRCVAAVLYLYAHHRSTSYTPCHWG